MANALEDGQSVDLYYCTKTKDDAVYLPTLEKIANKKSNLKIILFTESKNNYLTASYIQKNSNSLDGANYMICGPPSMMKSLKAQLKQLGIKKRNINTEEFDLS
jgi:predicted ferric reductase